MVTVAEVALPRGPRTPLSYAVPDALLGRSLVGCRVIVPLMRRRATGYVTSVSEVESPTMKLRKISDVLDETPLFDEALLELFRFIAGYYQAPLGLVIRAGLPNGLNAKHVKMATLTEAGRRRAALDPLLSSLESGRPVDKLELSAARVARLESDGLITVRYELQRPSGSSRMVGQIRLMDGVPRPSSLREGAGPAVLYALLHDQGPQEVRSLEDRVPNHHASVRRLVSLGLAEITQVQVFRDPFRGEAPERDSPPTLTRDQRRAVDAIVNAMGESEYRGFLLRGVTGSGKTEVYLHALAEGLDRGMGAIVLVPEIALTPQLAGRFRARFGDRVAVLHSGLSDSERLDQWQLIKDGKRPCVVGARSAIFAPVPNLGLIIVDEEHEPSFKQDETPRYHGRDMALKRGHVLGATVVLGSATPSLETVANATAGRLMRLDLPGRIGSRPMPEVELVDLRDAPPVRPEALLSQTMIDAVSDVVTRGEQAIVFLNRRGFAACFMCRTCGEAPTCTHCSVSLTFHRGAGRLRCHYCDLSRPVELMMVGTGTEQVQSVLAEEVPGARVARMDRDTTRGRALTELLGRFRAREIDVLVGTQMVAKGHDFPGVTLVGVLFAEQTLRLQDFRAGERTFQLLTQVAGRAGRHDKPGRVLVQTFAPDHHSLQCALTHDVGTFVDKELRLRRLRGFPPFGHAALVRVDHPELEVARDAAGRAARRVTRALGRDSAVEVIGPNPAVLERLKGRTRYQVLLLSASRRDLHAAVTVLDPTDTDLLRGARLAVDVDPVNLL